MTANASQPARPTVLVVDDEAPIREVVRRVLEVAGYEVTQAASGLEAIEMLSAGAPLDLLLADLQMPNLGGEEMARRLRATRPDLKVLYVTGHIDRLMDDRPVLWDGEAYLDKPFTAQALLEAVSLILYGTLKRNV